MTQLILSANELHVWWTPSSAAPAAALDVLTADERERHARFHFDADRQSYLAAHAMLRILLARYGSSGSRMPFEVAEHGKPFVNGGPEMSLTHTRGAVACAFAGSLAVGVDIEHVHRTNDWRRLMSRVLSTGEIDSILGLPEAAQQNRFYELWTLKEAWSKALGLGLHADFRSLDTVATDVSVFMALLDIPSEFRLAVAAEAKPELTMLRRFEWIQ